MDWGKSIRIKLTNNQWKHSIHLYTTMPINKEMMKSLKQRYWDKRWESIYYALEKYKKK